jgi:hypothetical protein
MIKQLLSILLFFMTACTVTAQSEASSKINTSADAWIKKYATQFTVYKDTVVTLDSTESAEVIFDFTKSVDYKLGVVLSGEVNATLQVEDGGIGAEVYAAGVKDALGNTIAESMLNIQDNSPLNIKVITLSAGIGLPCRYIVLKKK